MMEAMRLLVPALVWSVDVGRTDPRRRPRGPAQAELARLLSRGSPSRTLLRQRVELFVLIGAGLGALHLVAARSSGDHVALTAMLSALVPVFAPVCFVPVVCASRDRGHAAGSVIAVRIGVVFLLGALIATVHLSIWELLAATTGSIAGPSTGDIPFTAVVVLITTVLAVVAYEAPLRSRWAQPLTVAVVVVLFIGAFAVHGVVLTPTIDRIRRALHGMPLAIEVVLTAAAAVAVALLMRREVRDGSAAVPGAGGAGAAQAARR